jgi:putative cell wall-binding protein
LSQSIEKQHESRQNFFERGELTTNNYTSSTITETDIKTEFLGLENSKEAPDKMTPISKVLPMIISSMKEESERLKQVIAQVEERMKQDRKDFQSLNEELIKSQKEAKNQENYSEDFDKDEVKNEAGE